VRNVCVAMGNRGEPDFAAPLARALRDDRDALVRGHAAWALGRVAAASPGADAMRGEASAALDTAARDDADAWVREEARLALEEVPGA